MLDSLAKDQVIEVQYKGNLLKMKVLKFELNSGVIEPLITNILAL
ncbi:hypothetical protein [Clostridium algidicarnis]|nr:hypothetical protein [Clostridium algidicarnis]